MFKKLELTRILPVIVIDDAGDAVPLGNALRAGGQSVAEITLRTPAAKEAIRRMSALPGMHVGAGTVLSVEQADRAIDAGAQFIVCPGIDSEIVTHCLRRTIPVIPGVSTATDIMLALKLGVSVVKFFPAEQFGGAATIKALSAPFPTVKFIPMGGINADNMDAYLKLPSVLAIGGSWMVRKELLAAREFDAVTRLVHDAIARTRAA